MTQVHLFEEPRAVQQMPLDFEAMREIRSQERYFQINIELDYWGMLKNIIPRYPSTLEEMNQTFMALKSQKCALRPYSKMDRDGKLKYLKEIRHRIIDHLGELHLEEYDMRPRR